MTTGTKVKTTVAPLKWVFITGEGRNNAMPGEEPRMQYTASVLVEANSPEHKAFQAQIDTEWKRYKDQFGVKGLPKTNGMKTFMVESDDKKDIDPATEKVRKVDSGKVLITFKTNTTWPDGNSQVVKIFDGKGRDVTVAVHAAGWSIGDESTGIIHGTAIGNNVGGTHKVTLYLSAVQLAKLVKYEGSSVDAEDIGGEEIDLGDAVEAITVPTNTEGPAL